jgi:hypothetical protein
MLFLIDKLANEFLEMFDVLLKLTVSAIDADRLGALSLPFRVCQLAMSADKPRARLGLELPGRHRSFESSLVLLL